MSIRYESTRCESKEVCLQDVSLKTCANKMHESVRQQDFVIVRHMLSVCASLGQKEIGFRVLVAHSGILRRRGLREVAHPIFCKLMLSFPGLIQSVDN